ncbi:hypothetical protein D3C79_624810 [compost metagenome]
MNITGERPERSVNFSTRLCFQSLVCAAGNQPSRWPLLEAPTSSQGWPSMSLRWYTYSTENAGSGSPALSPGRARSCASGLLSTRWNRVFLPGINKGRPSSLAADGGAVGVSGSLAVCATGGCTSGWSLPLRNQNKVAPRPSAAAMATASMALAGMAEAGFGGAAGLGRDGSFAGVGEATGSAVACGISMDTGVKPPRSALPGIATGNGRITVLSWSSAGKRSSAASNASASAKR